MFAEHLSTTVHGGAIFEAQLETISIGQNITWILHSWMHLYLKVTRRYWRLCLDQWQRLIAYFGLVSKVSAVVDRCYDHHLDFNCGTRSKMCVEVTSEENESIPRLFQRCGRYISDHGGDAVIRCTSIVVSLLSWLIIFVPFGCLAPSTIEYCE